MDVEVIAQIGTFLQTPDFVAFLLTSKTTKAILEHCSFLTDWVELSTLVQPQVRLTSISLHIGLSEVTTQTRSTIQNLEICTNDSLYPGDLPPQLQSLVLGSEFNQPIGIGVLPSSLRSIVFGRSFNQELFPGMFPASLRTLKFMRDFNKPLRPGVLPPSLHALYLEGKFNHPITMELLPQTLRVLVFGDRFNRPLPMTQLSQMLELLGISPGYTYSLDDPSFPSTFRISFSYHSEVER